MALGSRAAPRAVAGAGTEGWLGAQKAPEGPAGGRGESPAWGVRPAPSISTCVSILYFHSARHGPKCLTCINSSNLLKQGLLFPNLPDGEAEAQRPKQLVYNRTALGGRAGIHTWAVGSAGTLATPAPQGPGGGGRQAGAWALSAPGAAQGSPPTPAEWLCGNRTQVPTGPSAPNLRALPAHQLNIKENSASWPGHSSLMHIYTSHDGFFKQSLKMPSPHSWSQRSPQKHPREAVALGNCS